jgi:NAD(P)-dependent dehydrogenase (short-subunit alcohol dehydrogenase family)
MSDQFAPYAKLFSNPHGPGDQRPTALKVVEDSDHANDWTGKVVLITGATSGIGLETARAMLATGADVFITARDLAKGQAVIDDLGKLPGCKGKMQMIEMDMNSLESVKKAAKTFISKSSKLNILINNAGRYFGRDLLVNDKLIYLGGVRNNGSARADYDR